MDLQPIYISVRANPHPNSCVRACVCEAAIKRECVCVCVCYVSPMCLCRWKVSAEQELNIPASHTHACAFSLVSIAADWGIPEVNWETVVTVQARGFGVLTLNVVFFFFFFAVIKGCTVGGKRLLHREHPVLLWPLRQTVCSLFRD